MLHIYKYIYIYIYFLVRSALIISKRLKGGTSNLSAQVSYEDDGVPRLWCGCI